MIDEFKDAAEVIERARQQKPNINSLTVWVSERYQFDELLFGANRKMIATAQGLWYDLLQIIFHDKQQLMKAGQVIINKFGGVGTILDVTYDVHEQALVWKVQYPVVGSD